LSQALASVCSFAHAHIALWQYNRAESPDEDPFALLLKQPSRTSHRFPRPAGVLHNEAAWDRALRIVAGLVLLYLGWAGIVAGTLGLVFKILWIALVVTGVVGYCALDALLGISTCNRTPTAGPPGGIPVR